MPNRDEKGRFVKGHAAAGPGRPPRSVERQYVETIHDRLPLPKWEKIVDRAVADAIDGDYRAREWVANYVIGKPPQILEIKASDAMLLRDVLAALDDNGLTPADVFNALLAELANADADEHD